MRILQRYILGDFLMVLIASLVVITFVMSIGLLFKLTELLSLTREWLPILKMFLIGIPPMLTFAIPVAVLMSCLLVFSRMASDGEIAAMRACGVGLPAVLRSVLYAVALASIAAWYINHEAAPRSWNARRDLRKALVGIEPADWIEEGRFVSFAGFQLRVGGKDGDRLRDVRVFDLRNPRVKREIKAESAYVSFDRATGMLVLDLRKVRVDPFLDDRPGALDCDRWPLSIPVPSGEGKARRRESDMPTRELVDRVADMRRYYGDAPEGQRDEADLAALRSTLLVEIHRRCAMAAACIAFALLGVPLGIHTHRRQSSAGIVVSLVVMALFYGGMVAATSLARRPELHPHWLIWLPVALTAVGGAVLLRRIP